MQPARPPVPVTVEGNRDDIRLQIDSFETNTHASCTGPCATAIPPGNYQIGMARGTGPVRSSQFVYIGGPGTLKATQISHTGLHVGGILLLIGGIIAQIGLSADAVSHSCDADCTEGSANGSELAAGTVIGILGVTAGIIMIAQKSRSDVTFVPLGTAALVSPREAGTLRMGTSAPQGAALQVRF